MSHLYDGLIFTDIVSQVEASIKKYNETPMHEFFSEPEDGELEVPKWFIDKVFIFEE